jgi:hypothetical protein
MSNVGVTDKKHFLGRNELNAILYKLKKYYNDLNKTKNEKLKRIDEMKETYGKTENKINDFKSYREINLEKEKIAIRNIEQVSESKDEVEVRIHQLNNKKEELKVRLKDEEEYTNTLLYMIHNEKQQLEKLNERLVVSQEKIIAIKHSKINFSANHEIHAKKKHNADILKRQIKTELYKLDDIISYQDNNLNEMNTKVDKKDESIKTMRKSLDMKNKELQNQVVTTKDRIEKNIVLYEEQQKTKTGQELKYITVILGLDIIKRYFIDVSKNGQAINSQMIINTPDYKTFISGVYSVVDQNDQEIFATENASNRGSNKAVIRLDDLIEKFKSLDLQLDSMMDFYSKLINKTSLYRQNMNLYNDKIIKLEGKKDSYTKIVQRIISECYKEFIDLIKDNPKFNGFMKSYITSLKANTNRKVKHVEPPITPPLYSDFYLKCNDQLSEFKSYYEFTLMNFKSMVRNCDDQNMITAIKATQKMIKNKIMKEYVNFAKLNKEGYIKSVFELLEKKELYKNEVKENDYKQLKTFLESQKNKEDFYDIKLGYEHILFYWFNHIDVLVQSMREVIKTINLCKNIKAKSKRTIKFDGLSGK